MGLHYSVRHEQGYQHPAGEKSAGRGGPTQLPGGVEEREAVDLMRQKGKEKCILPGLICYRPGRKGAVTKGGDARMQKKMVGPKGEVRGGVLKRNRQRCYISAHPGGCTHTQKLVVKGRVRTLSKK